MFLLCFETLFGSFWYNSRSLGPIFRSRVKKFLAFKKLIFLVPGTKTPSKSSCFPPNWSRFTATCVSFNLRHFSCQLINFEEFYSNFSDSNSKLWFFQILEFSKILSWSHKNCYEIFQTWPIYLKNISNWSLHIWLWM